jgi:hypothetical protein
MGPPDGSGTYRALSVDRPTRPHRYLRDADMVVLLAVVSPAFLALVVRTLLRGERFDTGPTVSAAIVVFALLTGVSAWRTRAQNRT